MKVLFFFIVSLVVFVQTGVAQTCHCTVKGIVRDSRTGENVAGALVSIKEAQISTFTEVDGSYAFKNICAGIYHVEVKIIGYKKQVFELNLEHTSENDVLLQEDDIHLQEVEVKAEKIESLSKNIEVLNADKLAENSGENLASLLTNITGVSVLQTGNSISKPVIHGMHSNRVIILNNGVRLESQQWGSEHAPEIDPSVAQKVTLIKGAAGVRYGIDAIGGIIKIEPSLLFLQKKGLNLQQAYFSNGNLFNTAFTLNMPFEKKHIYSRVNFSVKKGGDVSTPNYRLANTGLQEVNFSSAIGFSKEKFSSEVFFSQFNSKIGIFSGSHIGSVTDLLTAITQLQPAAIYTPEKFSYSIGRPYQDLQHSTLKVLNQYKWNSKISIEWTLSRQQNFRREVDILRGDKNLSQTFSLVNYTSEIVLNQTINKQLSFSLGSIQTHNTNISTGKLKLPSRASVIIPNYSMFSFSNFIIGKYLKNKFEIELGLRQENRHISVYELQNGVIRENFHLNNNIVGTTGFSYFPSKQVSFYANYSTANRPPSVNEWYSDGVHHGSASFEKGDINLKTEKASNIVIGAVIYSKKVTAEISLFSHQISDFIYLAPTGAAVLTIRGAFPSFKYTQTNASFNGVDATFNYNLSKRILLEDKVSILFASDKTNKQPLPFISPNKNDVTLNFDIHTHWLNEIELIHHFVAKQNRVPEKNLFQTNENIVFANYGGDYLPAPNAYQLVDIYFKNSFKISSNELIVRFEVKNVFNTVYRDYLNRFRYFADEVGRNMQVRIQLKL